MMLMPKTQVFKVLGAYVGFLFLAPACSKTPPQSSPVPTHDVRASAPPKKDYQGTLTAVADCLSNVDANMADWQDAHGTAKGLQAECPVAIRKIRHLSALLRDCRRLVEEATASGLLTGDVAAKSSEIERRLKEVEAKTLPESDLMVSCKKWVAKIVSEAVN